MKKIDVHEMPPVISDNGKISDGRVQSRLSAAAQQVSEATSTPVAYRSGMPAKRSPRI